MDIRPYHPGDLERLIDLTIETFRPFYEESFRRVVGDAVFVHQHGAWRDDYRRKLPTLFDPDEHKYVAVVDDHSAMIGYVAWDVDVAKHHGGIEILAVATTHRRRGLGAMLLEHAFAHMKDHGVEVVTIGTGGDWFHAPARALYETMGCTPFPNVYYFKQL
jgi:ribosomal protein S18 acetylase RimI-like enzyme